jgi:hypothetical protein
MVAEPGMSCLDMEYFCFEGESFGRWRMRTLSACAAVRSLIRVSSKGNSVIDSAVLRFRRLPGL